MPPALYTIEIEATDATSGPLRAQSADSNFRGTGYTPQRFLPGEIPASQRYFWSWAWQQGEREADEEIRRGETVRFNSVKDALAWLHEDDGEEG